MKFTLAVISCPLSNTAFSMWEPIDNPSDFMLKMYCPAVASYLNRFPVFEPPELVAALPSTYDLATTVDTGAPS